MRGYEVRCTQLSADKLKERDANRPEGQSTFQATLGMPVVIDENVPDGHVEVRCNGVLVKRYHIDV
jgi:hypothetical protein